MNKKAYSPEDPIAATATALVPAALGVIRTSGTDAIQLVSKIFSRPKALLEAKPNTIVYGWITDGSKPAGQQKIDEVLVAVYHGPKSYTGEDMAEIFCHGGTITVLSILNLLLANGFRQAEKGEFTFRSFINGKGDLTKAEAVKEIIGSKTDESRSRAAERLDGSLYSEIEDIKQQLLKVIASLEVEIEYPEDEENIAETFDTTELLKIKKRMETLCASWDTEKLYQDGAKVVLCGKTNAGKSSLFNVLLKEDRAIVSDIHGTTRDWLESTVSFDGIPVQLFDTAGLRKTDDVIEQKGVERSISLTEQADIILYLIDSSIGIEKEDASFIESFCKTDEKSKLVIVMNKSDKTAQSCKELIAKTQTRFPGTVIIPVSTKTTDGIRDLVSAVKGLLVHKEKTENTVGLGSERQKKILDEALDSVNHVFEVTNEGFTLDAAVQDIEDAISSLAEITGEVTPDDILESVFSSFCVGK
ncbi:MAG: tRNA uridine-5-carboxymethylaminomethyl(34) synthesis GTPase MnmE [Spirochaetaceae bacterium]|nr:tRNA uridine-5-carboxymethylaminomethyl(34) synthesis GTPase MnmE [Spirochaetaceae bacterium]